MKKIYVVGIGPGAYEQMTIRAVKVLENCEVIIGYTVYVDLVREHFAGKEFLTTPMKQEVERCRMAFETANAGKKTAMICSGDGIKLKNACWQRQKQILLSVCTIRPAKSGMITCRKPVI